MIGKCSSWLTVTLKWGGIAVAIVFAAALIWIEQLADAKGALSAAPVELYWILLAVGVIAAIIGFAVKKPAT